MHRRSSEWALGLGFRCGHKAKKFVESSMQRSPKGQGSFPLTWCSAFPLKTQMWEKLTVPSGKKNNFVSCLTSRAEEEDEHLERTLEQNKGKMAKKEEKCVLQ